MATATLPLQTSIEQFESIYADARGNAALVPWAHQRPNPALVNWLNAVAPSLVRCGARVCVVGCGLGDDARELIRRGYEVTAFDCSATAVQWAKRLDPANASSYAAADLFVAPPRWRHRFDLVVEINTIQSLPPTMHEEAVKAIAGLVSPHGHVLVICRASGEAVSIDDGPPWPLTMEELLSVTSAAGLVPADPISSFEDDEDPPVPRMRGLFRRL
jgi:SAM-dependent methyltransferase